MGIKVINGKVWDGKRMFEPGDTIDNLSEDDENSLVEAGKAEYADGLYIDEEEVVNKDDEEKVNIPPVNDESGETPPARDATSELKNKSSNNPDDIKIEFNADEYVESGNKTETPKKNRK